MAENAASSIRVVLHCYAHLADVVAMLEAPTPHPFLELELRRLQARIGRLASDAMDRRMRAYLATPLSERVAKKASPAAPAKEGTVRWQNEQA